MISLKHPWVIALKHQSNRRPRRPTSGPLLFLMSSRCHGLAPWCLTLTATTVLTSDPDATALRRGVSRSLLQQFLLQIQMPRPCAVEPHARRYNKSYPRSRCHGLAPWSLTLAVTTSPTSEKCSSARYTCESAGWPGHRSCQDRHWVATGVQAAPESALR